MRKYIFDTLVLMLSLFAIAYLLKKEEIFEMIVFIPMVATLIGINIVRIWKISQGIDMSMKAIMERIYKEMQKG